MAKIDPLRDKIRFIIIENNLNNSQFAEQINVQRSTISHIMAGRNGVTKDVLQKVMRWNPKYTFDWFFSEPTQEEQNITQISNIQPIRHERDEKEVVVDAEKRTTPAIRPPQRNVSGFMPGMKSSYNNGFEKKVVKVMVFYSDHTFESFDAQ
jgi:transcriptional regulator with XRE-family HTH domain